MVAVAGKKVLTAIGSPESPVLNAFMADREHHHSFIMGPLGSGKTYGCCQRLLLHMCEQAPNRAGVRKTRWLVIRNTYPDLMATSWKDFEAVFEGLGKGVKSSLEPPHWKIDFRLTDGTSVYSEVIFLALDRTDAIRKLRGYQLTGVWLNETKELLKSVVDMAFGRCPRYHSEISGNVPPTWYGCIGDTNAPDEDHWYYQLAEEQRPDGWQFWRQPGAVFKEGDRWVLNPNAENLANLRKQTPHYYENQLSGKLDDWISVNLANEYGESWDGKPVHPEFVDSVHVAPEVLEPIKAPLVIGADYGRTPAAAICQFDKRMGRWLVIDEYVTEDMSASLFGPQLKLYLDQNYPNFRVQAWGDPAGDDKGQSTEDIPNQLLQAAGIPIRPCHTNSVALRRAALARPATRLCIDGKPALLVSPKCKTIRKGLRGAWQHRRIQVRGEERYTDQPEKSFWSHVCEALEYALLGGGEGAEALLPASPRGEEYMDPREYDYSAWR